MDLCLCKLWGIFTNWNWTPSCSLNSLVISSELFLEESPNLANLILLSPIWDSIFKWRDKNNKILTLFSYVSKPNLDISYHGEAEHLLHRDLTKHSKRNPWRQSPGTCSESRAFNSPGNHSCVLHHSVQQEAPGAAERICAWWFISKLQPNQWNVNL